MIHHIIKGKDVADIRGHVVKMSDAESVYALLDEIKKEKKYEKENN